MEKYDAENAKLDVEVMPLMRILLADVWVPNAGDMPITYDAVWVIAYVLLLGMMGLSSY